MPQPRTIDLNADVGEGCASDAQLIPLLTSANIACGAHAGDELSMTAAARVAIGSGVTVGAHPGHADRAHFGRRELPIGAADLRVLLTEQVGRLETVVHSLGGEVRYVKLHGALYHQAGRDPALADALVAFASQRAASLAIVGQPGSPLLRTAERHGVAFRAEAFVDRTYQDDGRLLPRDAPGATLTERAEIAAQVRRLLGGELGAIETLCLHGDHDHAVATARTVRAVLEELGVMLR